MRRCEAESELVIAEGIMGLFDGAANGQGSTMDVAKKTGWPVILVVDAAGMAASAAALVHGFASYDRDLRETRTDLGIQSAAYDGGFASGPPLTLFFTDIRPSCGRTQ